MKLEPRILFDAAAAVEASQASDASTPAQGAETVDSGASWKADSLQPAATSEASTSQAPARQEVAFIDGSMPDADQLAQSLPPGTEVIWLKPDSDPWQQMSAALQDRQGIDAVHLFSHGNDGELIIAGKAYGSERLNLNGELFNSWRNALSADADLLLYGCDIAASSAGQQLADTLAELTGADVAASSDNTGNFEGDWQLEYATGSLETASLSASDYRYNLSSIALDGKSGWTAIMMGTNKDPDGDSQAGAADTDIIGDTTHASLYFAYDDNATAGDTSDDYLVYRMRIDNPTSNTYFGGVAIVGMDANLDGRIDLFMSVDGRNNTQAVKLMEPGTGLNNSPSTTTTSNLPIGWLPSNGIYSFSDTSIYNVSAVSAATDPHWGASSLGGSASDLTGDGKTDVFVSWKIRLSDIATVLAKPSPVDRNGNYGPRGSTGIQGFNENTVAQYVSFTQTQPGPINGDLNGVGASYDKNATFAALGTFSPPMSATNPVSDGPALNIGEPISAGVLNAAEDDSVILSGTSSQLADGTLVSLTVSDGTTTLTFTNAATISGGTWTTAGLDLSGLNNGTLAVTATAGSTTDSTTVEHDKTPPSVTIVPLASSGTPIISGTSSDVPAGTYITVSVDSDGNGVSDLAYLALVGSGGSWSVNTALQQPSSGSLPNGGLSATAKISASGSDAAGNTASATALNAPTVNSRTTNDSTPSITGSWVNLPDTVLSVTVNGKTYTADDGNLVTSASTWTLIIPDVDVLSVGSYEVIASAVRGSESIADSTVGELIITSTPVYSVSINGGDAASTGALWPTISGTSGQSNSFVIVRLDPNNDGDLSDAVTYSVATDAGGNWSLDTATQPISGMKPASGYIGANAVRVTDSTGSVSDSQTLTVIMPSISIGSIISTATSDSVALVNNADSGATWLNATEDNAVSISGTASGSSVDLVITDASGHVLSYTGIVVTGGAWSITGLDLSSLDNGPLTVAANLSGTSVSTTNSSVTHDATAPFIYNTTQTPIRASAGAVIQGSSDLPSGTVLTISIYSDSNRTALNQSFTATVQSDGSWSSPTSSNLSNNTTYYFRVSAPTNTTDSAGNLVKSVDFSRTARNSIGNSTKIIDVNPVTGDNLITSSEISGGVAITGSTSATSSLVTLNIVQNGVTLYTKTTTSGATYSTGVDNWSVTLTNAEVKAIANGQFQVLASVNDGAVIILSDAQLPTLALDSPVLTISDDTPGTATGAVLFTFSFTEAVSGFTIDDILISNGTKGDFTQLDASTYTLSVTPTAASSGNIEVSVANGVAQGVLTGRNSVGEHALQPFETTGAASAPTVSINTDTLASDRTPVLSGTSSLQPGAPILIEIDTDNDGTTDLSYSATVQGDGTWSLDIGTVVPSSGSFPEGGLPSDARITATAVNAYGNSTTATGLNKPAVESLLSNDSTPTLSGTWTNIPGDVLTVTVNGNTYSVGDGNLSVSGNAWSLTIPGADALFGGNYEVIAMVSRAGTDKVDISGSELQIDLSAPNVAITDISDDTGSSSSDFITSDNRLIYRGTAETGSSVLVTLKDASNNTVFQTTLIASGGTWAIDRTALAALTDGSYNLTAVATDAAGNQAMASQTLVIDTRAPVIAITSNSRTPDSTPTISGTTDLPPGSSITLEIDPNNDGDWSDKLSYSTTVQADGSWSVDIPVTLSGTDAVRAFGSDTAGNTVSASQQLTIDPVAPTLALDEPTYSSTGVGGSLDATEDDATVISGTTTTVPAGSVITVIITDGNLTITDSAIVQADGSWSLVALNLSALAQAPLSISASYTDADGNSYSDSTTLEHDKSATLTIDSISQDTGVIADFITTDNNLSISGSANGGPVTTVLLKDSGSAVVATFNNVSVSGGSWNTGLTGVLAAGTYSIEATIGGTTVIRALTVVDTTPPVLSSSGPADGATGISVSNDLSLTFSKNVVAGGGVISLYQADGTLVESFNVTTGLGSAGGSLSFDGTTGVTLNPFADLQSATGYYLRVDATAVKDSAGNAFAGIADSTTLNFTTLGGGDTTPPTATIVVADTALRANETSLVTITFSEAVTGFTTADLTVENGSLSGLSSSDGGITWTATLTPSSAVTDPSNLITLDNTGVSDAAGNAGTGTTDSNNYAIDTDPPIAPVVNPLVTSSATPVITGTATVGAGESLTVSVNGATYTVVPDASGNWRLNLATASPSSGSLGALEPGQSYSVTATLTDAAGNSTSDLTSSELSIVVAPLPVAPTQLPPAAPLVFVNSPMQTFQPGVSSETTTGMPGLYGAVTPDEYVLQAVGEIREDSRAPTAAPGLSSRSIGFSLGVDSNIYVQPAVRALQVEGQTVAEPYNSLRINPFGVGSHVLADELDGLPVVAEPQVEVTEVPAQEVADQPVAESAKPVARVSFSDQLQRAAAQRLVNRGGLRG